MGTKTLSIKDDVYRKLKRMKLEGESFSDTIGRLADRGSLSECSGLWGDLKDDEIHRLESTIEGIRRGATRELLGRLERP